MKTKNHNSINLIFQKLFSLFIFAIFTFSLKAQCDLEGSVMIYEFEEHERIYYKVPDGFDYKAQIQLDLLKLREKTKKSKKSIKIDRNYKMTENIKVLDTKNHFEKKEVRLFKSQYNEKEIRMVSGIFEGPKSIQQVTHDYIVTKERDTEYQNEFYIRKLNYLNGYFGWLDLDQNYFEILSKRGYMITTENEVITAQNETDKIIYDEANLIYYREFYNQGIRYTRFMKYYRFDKYILPRFIKLTESDNLFNGDCVERVTEIQYPENTVNLCISEPGNMLPRSVADGTGGQPVFYPNPVVNEFTINNPYQSLDMDVLVYDTFGKVVLKESFIKSNELITMNAEKLNPGLYIVQLVSGNDSVSFKLIKK